MVSAANGGLGGQTGSDGGPVATISIWSEVVSVELFEVEGFLEE